MGQSVRFSQGPEDPSNSLGIPEGEALIGPVSHGWGGFQFYPEMGFKTELQAKIKAQVMFSLEEARERGTTRSKSGSMDYREHDYRRGVHRDDLIYVFLLFIDHSGLYLLNYSVGCGEIKTPAYRQVSTLKKMCFF